MENLKLQINDLSVAYTPEKLAVKHVTTGILERTITAIMGPSGCGKSTLLRAINRMHELYPDIRVTGEILLDERNIFKMNPMEVRRMAGMVFQRPNPFPTMSIYDNVLAGYKLNGIRLSKAQKDEIVETSLTSVGLWSEVRDSLFRKGGFLSGGQQQRLCIARAIALKPEVLLMDEPTSALDPIATHRVEELMLELKKRVHDRYRNAQYGAGGADLGLLAVYVPRRAGRIRPHANPVHHTERQTDRRVPLRPVRIKTHLL